MINFQGTIFHPSSKYKQKWW